MPRQSELSQADVFAAIEAALAAGEYPTSARLRERLEGRGSPVVLQRFLGAWYAQHGRDLAQKVERRRQVEGDGTIRAQLEGATRDALAKFDLEHAARLRELEDSAAALSAREEALQAYDRRLEDRETGQRELIETLRADRQAAVDAAQEAKDALARLTAELEGERRRTEGLAGEVGQLRHKLAQRIDELGRATAAVAEQQGRTAALERQLVSLQRDHATALATVAELRGALREAQENARQDRRSALDRIEAATAAIQQIEADRAAQATGHASALAAAGAREQALELALTNAKETIAAAQAQHSRDVHALGQLQGVVDQLQLESARWVAQFEPLHDTLQSLVRRMDAQDPSSTSPR